MFRGNSSKEVHTNIVKVTTIKISKHYCTKRGNKPSIFPSLTVQTKSVSPLNLIFLLIFPNPNLNRKSKQIATKCTSELKIEFDLYTITKRRKLLRFTTFLAIYKHICIRSKAKFGKFKEDYDL